MAALRGSKQLSGFLRSKTFFSVRPFSKCAALNKAAWNKDWMPSKDVPETEEEKQKVADKYNVPVEEYKLPKYPYGDYPDLGTVSQQQRDPHYHWDDFIHRRDFGEFIDLNFNIHTEDRADPLYYLNNRYPVWVMMSMFLFVMFGIGGFWMYMEQYPYNRNYFDPQLPYNQKKLVFVSSQRHELVGDFDKATHYTFEPASE